MAAKVAAEAPVEPTISGPEKAAILLLSVHQDAASVVLSQLGERDIQKITNYAARLSSVPADYVVRVKREFCELLEGDNPLAIGQTKDQMKTLLSRVLPADRVEEISEFLDASIEVHEGLESLRWLDPQTIGAFLRNEHPQTIALILAYLEPAQAAQVLQHVPTHLQAEAVERVATLDRISPTIVRELNEVIKTELLASGATRSSAVGGIEIAAGIMNNMDKNSETNVFTRLDEANPKLADEIRELMFVFDDLASVDDRGIQMIMREVSNEQLTLAMKTTPDNIREKIFRNISTRAAEMIREELVTMGPVRLSDVEHAQQEIVKTARRLQNEGKVMLGGGGGDAYV